MNKKIINHIPFFVRTVPNCEGIVQCCKNLTHLTHLIKLHFWCLVCQMCHIIVFSTDTTSVVDALILVIMPSSFCYIVVR